MVRAGESLLEFRPPFLSLLDRRSQDEGGIDPLSLQATYEQLAERILPFITARMARPRFVTAIAVGARLCQRFGEAVADDGVTPPWLVYEWHVIEAFVRVKTSSPEGEGRIPGIQKVGDAVRARRSISAGSYLKTPKIFGFTGVYRRLATGLGIVDDDLSLDAGGEDLVRIWEKEQGLDGFLSGPDGDHAGVRRSIESAVDDALKAGHTSRRPGWSTWDTLARTLNPDTAGPKERAFLYQRLLSTDLAQNRGDVDATAMRREFIEALRRHGQSVAPGEERAFFKSIHAKASQGLRRRLSLILSYELLCRQITDALDLVLSLGARHGLPKVSTASFTRHPLARRIVVSLPRACERAERFFCGPDAMDSVAKLVERYSEIRSAEGLFDAILTHHCEAQRDKPPEGKMPWVESGRDGRSAWVRPAYRRDDPPDGKGGFVHHYRSATCSRFLRDLRRLRR
jgi:hypothetical protein